MNLGSSITANCFKSKDSIPFPLVSVQNSLCNDLVFSHFTVGGLQYQAEQIFRQRFHIRSAEQLPPKNLDRGGPGQFNIIFYSIKFGSPFTELVKSMAFFT